MPNEYHFRYVPRVLTAAHCKCPVYSTSTFDNRSISQKSKSTGFKFCAGPEAAFCPQVLGSSSTCRLFMDSPPTSHIAPSNPPALLHFKPLIPLTLLPEPQKLILTSCDRPPLSPAHSCAPQLTNHITPNLGIREYRGSEDRETGVDAGSEIGSRGAETDTRIYSRKLGRIWS